ncbi:MAG TPA: methyltransferase domain-containing protein [Gemmataceae bacterium]|jgi:ubiquinone/menaquinone biosynthesis C-methylase UbiE
MMPQKTPDSLAVEFRDVDSAAPDKILQCLDTLQTMEEGRAYKARALEHLELGPTCIVLDVACGLGDDVARMKARCARAVGVDRSRNLIAAARSRHADAGCEFEVADAAALPFPDETFDAVRVDRSLQHIAEPGRVVGEMARVTRRGGVVLCAEPDWGTYLLGGPHSALTERIQHDWIRRFQNPWIGRELSSLLAAAGIGDRRQEARWLSSQGFAESDLLFEIGANARRLATEFPEALPWLESYRAGEAYAGVLMLTCWGRKI